VGGVKTFTFFSKTSPYRWSDYVTPEEMERFDGDLDPLVLHLTNSVISIDLFRLLQDTQGYAFLIGKAANKAMRLPDKTLVIFKAHWKAAADQYQGVPPLNVIRVNDKKLKVYSGDDFKPVYLLPHKDPTLVWLSRSIVSDTARVVKGFDGLRQTMLTALSVPRDLIDSTEVLSTDQFPATFRDTFDLNDFAYVLYYHRDREILAAVGFNSEPELENACRTLSVRLQNDSPQ
jgi:hypothetical protein